ncbi:hypothetical protein C8J45_103343 [Sphingomonas sp. PP-CE-3G-477]|uniref:hypothetical protein n=1 Tax=Sphingomonas sp. PP-CE-3G-477 TaxID=2135660 RepID=UPI000D3C3C07|nr:hypothetical protein [Sphingomonas sp. PP-CE-3G-477]PTQ64493.1 hypothetical protein C8J45_103343 [Sphingomonas sp. PP-CE-3G-477]
MTDMLLPLAAIAGPALLMLAVHDIRRANRSLPLFRPSLRHRDEQGSGDVRGEGLFLTIHNRGD